MFKLFWKIFQASEDMNIILYIINIKSIPILSIPVITYKIKLTYSIVINMVSNINSFYNYTNYLNFLHSFPQQILLYPSLPNIVTALTNNTCVYPENFTARAQACQEQGRSAVLLTCASALRLGGTWCDDWALETVSEQSQRISDSQHSHWKFPLLLPYLIHSPQLLKYTHMGKHVSTNYTYKCWPVVLTSISRVHRC